MIPAGARAAFASLVIGASLAVLVTNVSAQEVEATITVAEELELGQEAEVHVALNSGGEPLANAAVTLYTDASFAGVDGDIEVGSATTDAEGVAIVMYEPRRTGPRELTIEYVPPGETEGGTATATVSVTGAAQLHQSEAGVQVPGLNVWLIIGVVGGVWFLLASVGWRVFNIAKAGHEAQTSGRPAPEEGGTP